MLSFLMFLARHILSCRYRLNVIGLETFDTKDPVIVFPNHPALIDPIILLALIGQKKILSPVMTETYFKTPGLGPILRALHTVPVGDVTKGGSIDDINAAFDGVNKALSAYENILIYPSGHIYVQSFEHTVGKKMAFEIVSRLPEGARIITVRTKGLWGSIWSKAYIGTSPKLLKVILLSAWYILANFIFFVPKRDVSIEFVDMTDELKGWKKLGLDVFNQKLQDYYNKGGNEECKFIPHYFYHNDVSHKTEPKAISGSVAELSSGNGILESEIPNDIKKSVIEKVATVKKITPEGIKFNQNLILELHCDSLDMAEIKGILQSQYSTSSNPPIGLLKTIGDLCGMVTGLLQGEEKLPASNFISAAETRISFQYNEGDTILTRAKSLFRQYRHAPFIYDSMLGEMSRNDFLLKSYVIGQQISKYKNQKIGIMMPALASTSLLIFGTFISGKLPVMLNWTVGEKSFDHCMNFAGLDHILTSRKFYEKIQSPWLKEFEEKMIFIEDIIREISISTKVIALIKKKLFLLPRKQKEAVMLFTSGSESLPKAVVLTHENLLSDIEGALALVPFREHETIIGFLPPFHSFGFTINTIFPLVAPVQAAYTPDPGDARTIGKILSHTSATVMSATPTFLRMIFSGNDKTSLTSLSYAFVGAEKCSDEVFSLFHEKCPQGVILEGYGITECSPIVTVNPLDVQKKGSAGKFLPKLTPMIRSIDGKDILPIGEQGMIYVSGKSIFEGYIDASLESPFDEFEGKKWYKTGDLGYIDGEGFLYITGRLKRFVKIAGEMISLPSIESILLEKYGNPDTISLAIEAKEDNGTVKIVAFSVTHISVDELNSYIHEHGAPNLVKIASVIQIDAIPLLGTGKTDYKQLKSLI